MVYRYRASSRSSRTRRTSSASRSSTDEGEVSPPPSALLPPSAPLALLAFSFSALTYLCALLLAANHDRRGQDGLPSPSRLGHPGQEQVQHPQVPLRCPLRTSPSRSLALGLRASLPVSLDLPASQVSQTNAERPHGGLTRIHRATPMSRARSSTPRSSATSSPLLPTPMSCLASVSRLV